MAVSPHFVVCRGWEIAADVLGGREASHLSEPPHVSLLILRDSEPDRYLRSFPAGGAERAARGGGNDSASTTSSELFNSLATPDPYD